MVVKKQKKCKQLHFYIHGDDELRKGIFNDTPLTQQAVFELFSLLDEAHYMFFLFYAAIPSSKGLWELFMMHLSAVTSGTSKNRNYCEDYSLLSPVSGASSCGTIKDKYIGLTGAAHGMWFELANPQYNETPNARDLWVALMDTGPSRQVWEWWFEAKCKELKVLWDKYMVIPRQENMIEAESEFEKWMEVNLGLLKPRNHWYAVAKMMLDTYKKSSDIKHKISKAYRRLAYTVAKSKAARNQPNQFFDTYNIANGGMMRAISKYAPSLAMSFPKFAKEEIRYEIFYQLGNYNVINLPNEMWQLYRKFEILKHEYVVKYSKQPSARDLALEYSLDYSTVFEVYFLVGLQNPCSLDTKIYPEDESSRPVTLKEKIEDHEDKESKRIAENSELILLSLQRMPLQKRRIFGLIYNLCDLLQDIEPDQTELHSFFFSKQIRAAQ